MQGILSPTRSIEVEVEENRSMSSKVSAVSLRDEQVLLIKSNSSNRSWPSVTLRTHDNSALNTWPTVAELTVWISREINYCCFLTQRCHQIFLKAYSTSELCAWCLLPWPRPSFLPLFLLHVTWLKLDSKQLFSLLNPPGPHFQTTYWPRLSPLLAITIISSPVRKKDQKKQTTKKALLMGFKSHAASPCKTVR